MNGWLVVNEYVNNDKFNELFKMLTDAAAKSGCRLVKYTNTRLWQLLCEHGYNIRDMADTVDFVLFWDKDIKLAKVLESMGMRLYNSAESIALCDDKSETFLALSGHGIKMPRTYMSPKIFTPCGLEKSAYMKYIAVDIGFPCVIKECLGSFGKQVYLAADTDEFEEIIQNIGTRPFIVQEYIKSSYGRDIRIQVVGNKVVAAMYRYNDNDFRANITNGGSMKPYEPDPEQCRMALEVCDILGLDFGGIDILFGEDDEPVLCEANSNAHFKNLYDCTGINVAEHIISYIEEQVRR